MDQAQSAADFLLANPIFLVPLLILVAVVVFAILKRLFKVAAILAIAAGLYFLILEYFGPGAPDIGLGIQL